jgi:hypothetical protein
MPYLVGLLTHHAPLLEQVPDIGEVLILNLDTNSMETRNLPPHEVSSKIPDLLRGSLNDGSNPQQCTYPSLTHSISPFEIDFTTMPIFLCYYYLFLTICDVF